MAERHINRQRIHVVVYTKHHALSALSLPAAGLGKNLARLDGCAASSDGGTASACGGWAERVAAGLVNLPPRHATVRLEVVVLVLRAVRVVGAWGDASPAVSQGSHR